MYIGLDLGTSGVKGVLVNNKGEIINEVTKEYPLLTPQEMWREQNPRDWFTQTIEVLKLLVVGYESKIRSLSFSGQMHGLVILDEYDNVIRPAILWNDQRTVNEVKYLNAKIGKEKLISETGNIAFTGFTAPKIMWLKNNEIDNFNKISKIMLPKDYLVYKLTNRFVSDVSDMSGTLFYNVEEKKYSEYMINLIGINKKQLPEVLESSDIVGNLIKEFSDQLNLPDNVKVIVGGGDQAVGSIGTGVVNNNDFNISLGTSGVVFIASDKYYVDKISYLHSFAHANKKYHLMGVTLAAGGSLEWFKQTFYNKSNYDEIFGDIENTKIKDTVYYLPYLSGERSPINDPYARGTFVGFSLTHNKKHFSRAVIEGITYSLKQIYESIKALGVNVNRIRLTGGGAKNDIWCQMIADIFGISVETIDAKEGPAYGAAILAMVGDKKFETVEDACNVLIKVDKQYYPNNENNKIYNKKYKNYVKLYQELKTFFTNLKEV